MGNRLNTEKLLGDTFGEARSSRFIDGRLLPLVGDYWREGSRTQGHRTACRHRNERPVLALHLGIVADPSSNPVGHMNR